MLNESLDELVKLIIVIIKVICCFIIACFLFYKKRAALHHKALHGKKILKKVFITYTRPSS